MNKLILSLAALGLAAGAAYAQETSFESLDADANGELSFEEITVAWPQLTQEQFTAADLDVSAGLSADEVAAVQSAAAATTAPTEAPAGTVPAQ
jgi:hypothetical protein